MKKFKLTDLVDHPQYENTHNLCKTSEGLWYLVPKNIYDDETPNKKFDCLLLDDKFIITRPHQLTKRELGLE